MNPEFIKGLIIGGAVIFLLLLLFRDLFLRRLLSNAVPMIQDSNTGELIDLESFSKDIAERMQADTIQNYKLLYLLKTTIDVILQVHDLEDDLNKVLTKKLFEIKEALLMYESTLKASGVDVNKLKDNKTIF